MLTLRWLKMENNWVARDMPPVTSHLQPVCSINVWATVTVTTMPTESTIVAVEFGRPTQGVPIRGIPYTLANLISHLLLYPSLWLLVPGWSSYFCYYFLDTCLEQWAAISLGNGYKILYARKILLIL